MKEDNKTAGVSISKEGDYVFNREDWEVIHAGTTTVVARRLPIEQNPERTASQQTMPKDQMPDTKSPLPPSIKEGEMMLTPNVPEGKSPEEVHQKVNTINLLIKQGWLKPIKINKL